MTKISALFSVIVLAIVVVFAINIVATPQTSTQSPPMQYAPSPDVKSKGMSPQPGQGAAHQMKKSTIGEDKAMVDTGADNSFWIEQIDLDGKGDMTQAQMLWDDMNKVLYIYADKTMMCANGAKAEGDFLIASYGAGNKAKKPAGSGWWMAELDESECGVKSEGMYGCKFNQDGVSTACGMVDLDKKNNDLTIIEAFRQ